MKKEKKVFVVAGITSAFFLGVSALTIFATGGIKTNMKAAKAENIDLVTQLCGGSTDGSIRSFVKDDYPFYFEFQGVTFGADYIAIGAGGYLRSVTSLNGLSSVTFATTHNDLAVSAGKLTSNGVERYYYFGKDYDPTKLADHYDFNDRSVTHLALQNLDDTNAIVINSMSISYSCEGDKESQTIEALGPGYTNYTWDFLGAGSESTPFLIRNASEWAKLVNYEKNYTGFHFKVTSDFSTNLYDTKNFMGYFDGNGHTITVTLNEEVDNLGLFSRLSGVGSVYNLTIDGTVTNGGKNTGGLVGSMADSRGVISNCNNYATVTNTVDYSFGSGGTAGLVGFSSEGGTFTNCNNYGTIQSTGASAGGIIGGIHKSGGSLVATISGCKNFGNVTCGTSGDKNCSGGILGFINYTALLMDDCQNGDATHTPVIKGAVHVGGIVGCAFTSMIENVETSRVNNCQNYGTVFSTAASGFKTGGILGTANIPATNCSNYGAVSGNNGASVPTDLIASGTVGWIIGNRSSFAKNNSSGNTNYYGV